MYLGGCYERNTNPLLFWCKSKKKEAIQARMYNTIHPDYVFSSEEMNLYFCIDCVRSYKKDPIFRSYKIPIGHDIYINDEDYHLDGEAYFLILKNNMYALYYETSLCTYDYEKDEPIETPFLINVVIRGKTIIGEGSTKYKDTIDELTEYILKEIKKREELFNFQC